MENKHQFIITKYCPCEVIFEGSMTFTEARQFMDKHASDERRVSFEVFNNACGRWENYRNVAYHGGRKVYDNGVLYILDPDYRNMWKPEHQQWQVWCVYPNGERKFCQSFSTSEKAEQRAIFLRIGREEFQYEVCRSDIQCE